MRFARLGYTYFAEYGEGTPVGKLNKNNNVLTDEFLRALVRLNPEQKLHDLQIFGLVRIYISGEKYYHIHCVA